MVEPHSNYATRVPDENLVELAQAGSEEAFSALFERYSSGICAYVRGLVRSPEDADELAQEIFARAWEKLFQLRHASQFKPWLYRIATNIVNDYGRRERIKQRFKWLSLDECDDLDSTENVGENLIDEQLVKQAWKTVPRKYRECLLLEIKGQLTRREIADVVGIHENSVGTYISNARKHFRHAYNRLQEEKSV
jgi:RNA polymerase sigma-70 factor, ECF subfamily